MKLIGASLRKSISSPLSEGLTLSQIKTLFNVTGDAPIAPCRAFVHFDGTGTPTVQSSFNISSVADDGTGDYGLNLTTALTTVEPSCVSGCGSAGYICGASAQEVSLINVITRNTSGTDTDRPNISVAVFA